MTDSPELVLYRLRPTWGLPSLSIGCIQVEAYLRLAKMHFAVQDCAASSSSPTGLLPALDAADELVGPSPPADEFAAAKALFGCLNRKGAGHLDRALSAAQRAELVAFAALVESKLQPALVYSTWCEADAYAKHTRQAYGGSLAFPLNYLLPRAERRAAVKAFSGTSAADVYADAAEALDAIAGRLVAASRGGFFFGSQPSSLDARLFGCLSYLRAAPVVHEGLQRKMRGHGVLGAYLDRIAEECFSAPVPCAADAGLHWSQWESGAATGGRDERYSKQQGAAEVGMRRKAKIWLAGAALAIVAYVLLSGDYIEVSSVLAGDLGEDDDGEGDVE